MLFADCILLECLIKSNFAAGVAAWPLISVDQHFPAVQHFFHLIYTSAIHIPATQTPPPAYVELINKQSLQSFYCVASASIVIILDYLGRGI